MNNHGRGIEIEAHKARGLARGKWQPRNRKIRGVVVHTTGSGPFRRFRDNPERFPTPFDAAVHIFENVVDTGAHYVVCGETGRVASMAPHRLAAWHVGGAGAYKYQWPYWYKLANVTSWRDRWPELKSPRDFFGGHAWRRGTVNNLTIGIEVAPPTSGPRNSWSEATWFALSEIITTSARLYRFPVDRYHVATHSDVHPLNRFTKSGHPWDPGEIQWPSPLVAMARLIGEKC